MAMFSIHDHELVLAVVVATAVFLILAAFSIAYFMIYKSRRNQHRVEIAEFKKQFESQLLQSRIEVQEMTFQQIGKELHDNVGQLLSSSRMLLGLTERSLEHPPDTLLTANATLGEAISQLRSLSKSLDRDWLERFNFSDNLRTEIMRINTGHSISAVCNQCDEPDLNPGEQIILFRIVQEAIQNAIKHANPKNISISVVRQTTSYVITVIDDGTGFTGSKDATGMGLSNMRHRTMLLRGTIDWSTDNGTTVRIILPQKTAL